MVKYKQKYKTVISETTKTYKTAISENTKNTKLQLPKIHITEYDVLVCGYMFLFVFCWVSKTKKERERETALHL